MVVQADNLRRAQSGEHHLTKLVEQAGPMFARNQVNQRWISGESTRWNEFLSESKRWNEFLSESKFQVYKSYQIDSFHHFISHFVVGCLAPSGARFRGGSGTPQHLGGGTTGWKTTTWDWWISWWWIYESMNLKDFFNKNIYVLQLFHVFFLKKSSHIIGFMKVKHTGFFFNGRNTEASEWMRTRPWNGALIEAEAVHHLWTCDFLTCQGLWENVRSKHGNEMRRKWRQHLDLMEKNLSDLGGVF